ncbi:MAG: hypothetical protein JXO72_00565 [Vicinamibacteria bacterium]|nr:hypothetical protein [Vicinamibacteria bacterium]
MIHMRVEYVGFSSDDLVRAYNLRVMLISGEVHSFILLIPNDAFLSHRIRYQDGPEVCYMRLQRDLIACGKQMPPGRQTITDDDMELYRAAHAPKPPKRRPPMSRSLPA